MKTYNEMAQEVFRIGDERIKKSKSGKKKLAAVLSVAVAAVIAVTVWQSGLLKANPQPISQKNETSSVQQTENTPETTTGSAQNVAPETVEEGETAAVPENEDASADGGVYGGESTGGVAIPCFPLTEGIEYSGEKLTDADAKEYFAQNGASIISALSASGVDTGNAVIKEKGYCHASYDGTVGKPLTVKQDFRDYLVYNGDKIIAIITLYKENGKIYNSPAFGAPWFDDYAKYLNQHKGEELVYLYANWMEIIVAPDGSFRNPTGYDCSEWLDGVNNLYDRVYCPEIVYVP